MPSVNLRRVAVFALSLAVMLVVGVIGAAAQQGDRVSGKITAAYTHQDSLAVGDVSGHIMSLSEARGKNSISSDHSFMDGANVVIFSYTDLIWGNGVHQGYTVFTMGADTVFAKAEGKVTTVPNDKGTPSTSFEGTFTFRKGTGQYANIKGSGTYSGSFTSKTEYTVEWQSTYTLGKP